LFQQGPHNAPGSLTVAVGINGPSHLGLRRRVIKQVGGDSNNAVGVGPDEAGGTGFDGFRAFGGITQHQYRHA
jgi:hypothetical protein